ncbi:hypothetical protein ABVK25_005411 [Lepraria finkii]|uniref:Apple domain-containing protein n=1 Tax=Lepraria finkii TaxID=1340010 RepID=A0ABR4B9I7_9LECA
MTPATSTAVTSTTSTDTTTSTIPQVKDTFIDTSTNLVTGPKSQCESETWRLSHSLAALQSQPCRKRSVPIKSRVAAPSEGWPSNTLANSLSQEFNRAVLVEIVQTRTIVSTARKTVMVTAATPVTTSTSIIPITVIAATMPVDVRITITVPYDTTTDATITVPSTSTDITTNTVTSTLPDATYYTACDSNNLITTVDGGNLDSIYFNGDTQVIYSAGSAYGCCVACILNPHCSAVFYFGVFGSMCTGVLDGTCTARDLYGGELSFRGGDAAGAVLLYVQ